MIIERRPLIIGSDPTIESTLNPNGSVNPRAVWKEHAIFYKGPVKTIEVKGKPTTVYGFADLQGDFDSDGKAVYSICAFLHYGLRNPDTYEEYGSYHFGGDPLHAYRVALCMQELPRIGENPWEDWVRAYQATQKVFDRYGTTRGHGVQARREVSNLIGEEKMFGILQAVPNDLEETISRMEKGYAWVDVKTLRHDIESGIIQPSEYYLDIMRRSRQRVLDLADQIDKLEQQGGIW